MPLGNTITYHHFWRISPTNVAYNHRIWWI